MKIISGIVENFASYGKLEFSFNSQGLCLISGPTGAGKSTLCDIIPWILFGITSKDGTVDEVRSWNTDGTTEGTLYLEHSNMMSVTRIRGKNGNDLYYEDMSLGRQRGKDLNDTQKIINDKLGIDAETYLLGAYLHEFSATSSFFSTTAKQRRQLTERIADLSLAVKLTENTNAYKKEVKKEKEKLEYETQVLKKTIENAEQIIKSTEEKSDNWEISNKEKIEKLERQSSNYHLEKGDKTQRLIVKRNLWDEETAEEAANIEYKISDLKRSVQSEEYFSSEKEKAIALIDKISGSKCTECGNMLESDKKLLYLRQLDSWKSLERENNAKIADIKIQSMALKKIFSSVNPYIEQIEQEKARPNIYLGLYKAAKEEKNPFISIISDCQVNLTQLKEELRDKHKDNVSFSIELSDLELLTKIIDEFRGLIVKNTINRLEQHTNKLLTDYFDAELRVKFEIENSDKLNVSIAKDGNSCTFTQLSKGQRQLLKLCFGLSVMRQVSNHSGTNFNCIFLDEPTDGCDESLKLKSYRLLEQLATEHESVFVIDHNEMLKSMFSKRYNVSLIDGKSQIEEA